MVQEAIEQFISFRKGKTVAAEGRRPKLSFDHWRNTGYWLREFAATFPGNCVADLTKEHVNLYMASFNKAAPKTRDERRGIVKMFLAWCVEQDYLAPTHRLFEASEFKREAADPGEIECYRAGELRAMLARASRKPKTPRKGKKPEADYRPLLPFLALAALAGIREKEIMRLTWEDVFRVPGHIEVSALKSKTRARRLVQMCSALAQWLEPYRGLTGLVWTKGYHRFHEDFGALRAELKIPHRRNGLRHSFVSAHFASYSDEGLTAAQAGNTPALVHKNYKGLMTKQDGEAWFALAPAGADNIITLPAHQTAP
jgi:integrase